MAFRMIILQDCSSTAAAAGKIKHIASEICERTVMDSNSRRLKQHCAAHCSGEDNKHCIVCCYQDGHHGRPLFTVSARP